MEAMVQTHEIKKSTKLITRTCLPTQAQEPPVRQAPALVDRHSHLEQLALTYTEIISLMQNLMASNMKFFLFNTGGVLCHTTGYA